MFYHRSAVAALSSIALFGYVLCEVPLSPVWAIGETGQVIAPPSAKATDPWDVATRDSALAKVYETVALKLLKPALNTPESIASEKHIAVRLAALGKADPENAFPIYLAAHVIGRYGNWKGVIELLREANAAPRVVYPMSGDVLNRAYPACVALRNLARIAHSVTAGGTLTDADSVALLTEICTMGNRLARLGEPRTPILVGLGGDIRQTGEKALAAVHDRAGRTAEAAAARVAEDKTRVWNEAAMKRYKTTLGKGGAEVPEVMGAPFGITAADIGNLLNHIPLASVAKRRQVPAFNRALAGSERRMADRALKEMPE